jgi:hypothetical protein
MPLTAGARLGPYEILAPLGAGGMGSACGRGRAIGREAAVSGGGAPRTLKNENGDLAPCH